MKNNIIFSPGDVYNVMKTKQKNDARYVTFFTILWNTLLEMFEWENLPDTIPKRFLEGILHLYGEVFVCKEAGTENVIASYGTLAGEVDCYGMGTECIATYPGNTTQGKRGVDIAYGINNDSASPDSLIYWISHLLGEISKSEELNVEYSRHLPIPIVKDEKDKNALNEILKKLNDGELSAFVSKNVLAKELGCDSPDVFNISDVKDVDKLQYLSRYYDDVIKRFYNVYGQALQNQNKTAQSISDELHGMDSVSFIIPLQMLKCRKALCQQINDIFGLEVEVRFSDAWQLEYEAFKNRDLNDNGIPDHEEMEDDTESTLILPENDVVEENMIEDTVDEVETEIEAKSDEIEEPSDLPAMELDDSDESSVDSEKVEDSEDTEDRKDGD